MNILSLFDGMSCLQIAVKELGISHNTYYASEIDQHAIKQTQLNFPDTIQLGSVTEWKTWNIDWSKVGLIGAGSPCQGFSFAGKQLAFDDPRSKLFFVFIDILNHCRKFNQNVRFLLENVDMKREHMKVINDFTGVFPVNINSNLVSAQNRNRWYWSNIRTKQVGLFGETHTDIPQPKDRGILLKDILEKEVPEKYYLSDKMLNYFILNTKQQKENKNGFNYNPHSDFNVKSKSITTKEGSRMDDNFIVAMRGRNQDNPSERRTCAPTEQRLELNLSGKTNCLTSVQKDNLVMQLNENNRVGGISVNERGIRPHRGDDKKTGISELGTILYDNQKTDTHLTNHVQKFITENRIRRLTPLECARLQTIPEWYKWQFVEMNYFGYICSVTKKIIICKANVTPMAVPGQFQISQQDYATCTTLDLLELEKLRVEKLTKQKSVKLMDAIDMLKQKSTETYVSCITKDFIDMGNGNFQSNNTFKNVNFAISKLEEEELMECAPVIIEVSNCMEIHLLLKKVKKNPKYQLNQQDIMGVRVKNRDTKMLWSIKLGDLLKTEKLSTILTLANWIIDRKIYTYVKDVLNIHLSIGNLNVSEQNYINVELSDLRMESIISCSDTQQYKMLGNGWTIEVIKHILSFLAKEIE